MIPLSGNESRCCLDAGGRHIEFQVRPGDDSHLQIDVFPNGRVVVAAPPEKTMDEIRARIGKKLPWILKQLDFFEQFQPLPTPKRYVSGETHYYLGRQYRLKVVPNEKKSVKLKGRFLTVRTPSVDDTAKTAEQVEVWYRHHAGRIFAKCAEACFEKLDDREIAFPEIRLRRMPKRWGSCTPSGRILLNPELVKAPSRAIEYVIMHELCHLKYRNHSKAFFRLLSRCMPDWQERKKYLKSLI